MATKYIIQDNSITKIVYIGGCQSAKGGHRKAIEPADTYYQSPNYVLGYVHPGEDMEYDRLMDGVRICGKYHEKNYRARGKKRKRTVEELILNNFEPRNSCMLTLTFSNCGQTCEQYEIVQDEDMSVEQELKAMLNCLEPQSKEPIIDKVKVYDPKQARYKDLAYCNKLFKQFVQRMKYRFPLFRYVAVTAQQSCGSWHYHLVCNLNYIPFDELRTMWGNGAVYFKSFKQTGMEGLWKSVRYLQKNMRQAELKGAKGYLCSKGLNRNLVYRSWVPSEAAQADATKKALAGIHPDYSYETYHDYTGISADACGVELTATTKYFKFFQSNIGQFAKLPNAYQPKRTEL